MTSMEPIGAAGSRHAPAVTRQMLDAIGSEALIAFLLGRRWFGAKGTTPREVRVREVIPLPWGDGRLAIATLDVVLGDDRTDRYQLPLAWAGGDTTDSPGGRATLGGVESAGGPGRLIDATDDPAFRDGLAAALARGATIDGDGARWVAEPIGDHRPEIGGLTTRLSSAEQSNTSIIVGDVAIIKLFRKLEHGENPDVEIGRFLTTRTGFRGTPALFGVARLEGGGGSSVAAILQRFVAGSGDAWQYALESARRYFALPEDDTRTPPFVDDARRLARVTRQLHDALASDANIPDFAPQPATRADVARWAAAAKRSVDDGFSLLAERVAGGALSGEAAGGATVLLRRRGEFAALIDEIEGSVRDDAGMRIRHHGDYHLGQVLRTPDGAFMIIDFEGEPARPLAERRALQSPLRDVAGMLRSFAYAAATAATDLSTRVPRHTIEIRSGRWLRDVRQTFVQAYLQGGGAGTPGILPSERASITQIIALFEIEKVFYELRYELHNRPDWVWIPLRGIARLTESGVASA